jgi:exodeoxyribonuclease V alpha subunit
MDEESTLEGSVERIVFTNPENQFTVLRLRVEGEAGLATVVGQLPPLSPGEGVRFTGTWTRDRRFGRQFQAQSFELSLPATRKGLARYLVSVCKGIGDEKARRIVDRFGEGTPKVIEETPERLLEVEGIGPALAKKVREGWNRERGIREVMIYLRGHDISPRLAMKIWKAYGARSVERIREDPYAVAGEIEGIGWKTADRIARSIGIPADAPARIEAGALYLLGEAADQGHTCASREYFERRAADFLETDPGTVEAAIERLLARRALRERHDRERGPLLFLPRLDAAEREVAADLARLAGAAPAEPPRDLDDRLAAAISEGGIDLDEGQRAALGAVLHGRILVVTGGPGTGKTTLVRTVIRLLERLGVSVLLAAPTGRAAKRLSEATARPAATLHRLLEWDPRTGVFGRARARPLEAKSVIVDEASMVDLLLMQALVAAIPTGALLLLVGDTDQLPPVGPGNVLRDLIASGAGRVVRLDKIYRQTERSTIVLSAHRVNRGELPEIAPRGAPAAGALDPAVDFHFLDSPDAEGSLAALKGLVTGALARDFGLDPFRDLQVLSPMYRGAVGVDNLNRELQALLNPEGTPVARGETAYRLGDKVMQIRNNYQKDVWNGDIGRVVDVHADDRELLVDFDGRLVAYEWDDLDEITLAYACSVHKSQGSEYRAVILPLHMEHAVMLRRNLLYTAITRGRRWVFLVGERRALSLAVRNTREESRVTALAERLRGGTSWGADEREEIDGP